LHPGPLPFGRGEGESQSVSCAEEVHWSQRALEKNVEAHRRLLLREPAVPAGLANVLTPRVRRPADWKSAIRQIGNLRYLLRLTEDAIMFGKYLVSGIELGAGLGCGIRVVDDGQLDDFGIQLSRQLCPVG